MPQKLMILPASIQLLSGLKSLLGDGGSLFVSLRVTYKVMGLLVMGRKLNFNACSSDILLISSLVSSSSRTTSAAASA